MNMNANNANVNMNAQPNGFNNVQQNNQAQHDGQQQFYTLPHPVNPDMYGLLNVD